MKVLHNLITNTTSLVGYIAVLMFVGAYIGGDKSFALDSAVLKGNLGEYMSSGIGKEIQNTDASLVITIDGRQYEAKLIRETPSTPKFPY